MTAALVAAGCSRNKPIVTKPKIIAHRGASGTAPENTVAAIERAWELGADGVEIDVRLSADSQVVVIHDDTTRRTGGVDRPVSEETLEQLQQLDIGGGNRIPTLAEAIAAVPAGRRLFVEIKTGPDSVPIIAGVIEASGRVDRIAIEAFDPDVIRGIRGALPTTQALWVVGSERRGIQYMPIDPGVVETAKRIGATGIAYDWRGANPELSRAIDDAGLTECVWTIDAPDIAARFSSADWIETNYPERLSRRRPAPAP